MKIAGRKNDGAWWRANQTLHGLSDSQKGNLVTLLSSTSEATAALAALQTIATKAGISMPSDMVGSPVSWCHSLIYDGVPRQVWFGVTTFDTYTKQTDGRYVKDAEPAMRLFAIKLRKIITQFIFASRELNDVLDIGTIDAGNPGGIPDTIMPKPHHT
jgi:hypothetical protein